MTSIPQSPASRAKSKGMAAQIERQELIKRLKKQMNEWNRMHPEGTRVIARGIETRTVHKAFIDAFNRVVTYVEAKIGSVPVDDCEVVK